MQEKRALGNAWYVKKVDIVKNADEERKKWDEEREALLAKLKESEQLAQRASMTDDERAKETALAAQDQGMAELVAQREKAKNTPCLLNLSEDPQMDGRIIHFLEYKKDISFGRKDANPQPDIILAGLNIAKLQCIIHCGKNAKAGFKISCFIQLFIYPTFINQLFINI